MTADYMTTDAVIDCIEALCRTLSANWRNTAGWAPPAVTGILDGARLDWQVSLSSCLRLWRREPPAMLSDGELILAWANLGALTEGAMRLLLTAYYRDYEKDVDALKKAGGYHNAKQTVIAPDEIYFETTRKFFEIKALLNRELLDHIDLVQKRRNAIHAFRGRALGNDAEFWSAVRDHLKVLRAIDGMLPSRD